MTGSEQHGSSGFDVDRLKSILRRAMGMDYTDAECPTCGGSVTEAYRGLYECRSSGHPNLEQDLFSRGELEGEFSWWEGRLPLLVGLPFAIILAALDRGEDDSDNVKVEIRE